MHLTNTNFNKYFPLEGLCSSGLVTQLTVLDLSPLMYLIESIEDLFDEEISVEVICADYLSTAFDPETHDHAEALLLEDYNAAELFATLSEDDKALVYEKVTEFLIGLWDLMVDNTIEADPVTPWQVMGRRGRHHLVLLKTVEETVT